MFRDLVFKNWWLKLAGILLAYALWLLARGSGGERFFAVPLAVQIPANMEIVNERPATVEITIEGLTSLGGPLPDLTCTVDLRSAGEGEHRVALRDKVHVNPVSYANVVSVVPSEVVIVLERAVSREVRVRVPLQGTLPQGIELYSINTWPASARVTGGRSRVNPVQEATTEPLDLSGHTESFQSTLNIRLQRDDIHASPVSVQAQIHLGPRRSEYTVSVPVSVAAGGFAANPPEVAVTALVPVSLNRRILPGDFRATVGLAAGEESADQVVATPDVQALNAGITIIRVKPEKITLFRKGKK